MQNEPISIAMLGATGAVGGEVLNVLLKSSRVERLSLFGRRNVELNFEQRSNAYQINQHIINIFEPEGYHQKLIDYQCAICTLGIGEPSKVSKAVFIKIDKLAVIDFAKACKAQGVKHFSLLASVGTNSKSASFYLRTKGELIDALVALDFERLSIFQPSMILTPTNRYGWTQWLTLNLWPLLTPLLIRKLKKYRGVKVSILGQAMAYNLFQSSDNKVEYLRWNDFQRLSTK